MVVFCGLDCSGKSTIIDRLYGSDFFSSQDKLMFHPPKEWYEETDILSDYNGPKTKLVDKEEVIYTRDIRKKLQQQILLGMKNGSNYVFHRYIFSLYTYYAGSQTVPLPWIDQEMIELIVPDEVIYLRMGIDEFKKRSSKKPKISFQQQEGFVERMIACYDNLAEKYNWKVIDTEKYSVEETVEMSKRIIRNIDTEKPIHTIAGKVITMDDVVENGGCKNE